MVAIRLICLALCWYIEEEEEKKKHNYTSWKLFVLSEINNLLSWHALGASCASQRQRVFHRECARARVSRCLLMRRFCVSVFFLWTINSLSLSLLASFCAFLQSCVQDEFTVKHSVSRLWRPSRHARRRVLARTRCQYTGPAHRGRSGVVCMCVCVCVCVCGVCVCVCLCVCVRVCIV